MHALLPPLSRSVWNVLLAGCFALALLGGCGDDGSDSGVSAGPANHNPLLVRYEDVTGAVGLAQPIFLTAPPGDARLFIAERAGRIHVVQGGTLLATPFLDLRTRISTAGEGGLLSFAFDPQFSTNGFVYVHFTNTAGNIVVERFFVPGGSVADPVATPIISIPHPTYTNHYGGRIAFGPDGYLYLSTGDGGGGGDPDRNGQNLNSLLGKLLRLDVSTPPYAIPPTNPFINQVGRRPEIWAYGLRNPWRFAFDPPTASLYIADVGQGLREEIDAVSDSFGGTNYGWPIMEGTLCYPITAACSSAGLQLPVHEYDHREGCSITGGFVYRGAAMPELQGRYFYADFCSGWLRSILVVGGRATERIQWNVPVLGQVISFGQDAAGELYVLTANGRVVRIVRA
jgi:glucose/arabinose dehydrogenase